jgi:hypothetical protein
VIDESERAIELPNSHLSSFARLVSLAGNSGYAEKPFEGLNEYGMVWTPALRLG